MSSGSKSKKSSGATTVAQQPITPVPTTQLQTTGYGGMGNTPVPQTYTAEAKPAWMQGAWDMPAWGQSAANPQQALTQEMLQPQAQPPQQQVAMPDYSAQIQALLDQINAATQKQPPPDPRTMSTNQFLKGYLFNPKKLQEKFSDYNTYQYEKAQGRAA